MRKLKELFRLKFDCQLSNRKTANSCGISRPTVSEYLFRAAQQGLTWETMAELSEEELENRLLQKASPKGETSRKPWPDFERVHQELKSNKQVTLMLLYEEYRETYPDTHYSHAWFYAQYQNWKKKLDWVMRQDHKGGEKLFLDYCDGPSLVDPKTGAAIPTHLFAAVWGASNYTFAEASLSQNLESWIKSNDRAFTYFQCVPHILVPDNLKSGVTKACHYEPDLNPTFHDFAVHYGTAVIPARPVHPKDKAKVEVGVQIAQRWILARLRHRQFFNLADLNAAIGELLENLNNRPLKKMKVSQRGAVKNAC